MTTLTSIKVVNDGDKLAEGYFNNVIGMLGEHIVKSLEDASTTTSIINRFYNKNIITEADPDNSTCFTKCGGAGGIAFTDHNLDNFNDSSIDSDIWTTTSPGGTFITESGSGTDGNLDLDGGVSTSVVSANSDGVNGVDFGDGTDREVILRVNMSTGASAVPGTQYAKFEIVGSTSGSATIKSLTGASQSFAGTMRLVFDNVGQQVYVYDSLTDTASATVDLSSLVGTQSLYFERAGTNTANGSARIILYQISYADGSNSSVYVQSVSTTILADSTWAVNKINDLTTELTTTTLSSSISFDGTTFATAPNGTLTSSTAGSTLKTRIIGTSPSTISVGVDVRNVDSIDYDLTYRCIYGA